MRIKEELLHYIWQVKRFDMHDLKTERGQSLSIIDSGTHNHNAGPDFLNARIELDGVLWAGHVEIHIRSSDWKRHGHVGPDYQNVILHVVFESDVDISLLDTTEIPCLELKRRIKPQILSQYHDLMHRASWVVCASLLPELSEVTKISAMERALAQRLETKAADIARHFKEVGEDLHELIYQRIAWSFGLTVNAEAMLELTRSIPFNVMRRQRGQLIQIEALLFGQSGLLPKSTSDPYLKALAKEYHMLRLKYSLVGLNPVIWKFSRMRPSNFPTLRLAQFARLLFQISKLDSFVFDLSPDEIFSQLHLELDGYWTNHYTFEKTALKGRRSLGRQKQESIVINGLVPIIFFLGDHYDDPRFKQRAIYILQQIRPERNKITRKWQQLGMPNDSAADSQGLIELKKENCANQLCIKCPIGDKVLTM